MSTHVRLNAKLNCQVDTGDGDLPSSSIKVIPTCEHTHLNRYHDQEANIVLVIHLLLLYAALHENTLKLEYLMMIS